MTVTELYQQKIEPLPVTDRLALAAMILNGIPAEAVVDFQEAWSDDDLDDLTRSAWQHIQQVTGDKEDA